MTLGDDLVNLPSDAGGARPAGEDVLTLYLDPTSNAPVPAPIHPCVLDKGFEGAENQRRWLSDYGAEIIHPPKRNSKKRLTKYRLQTITCSIVHNTLSEPCYTAGVSGTTSLGGRRMKGNKIRKSRWFEAFALTSQMFRDPGEGVGRVRGPRLAEPPKHERGRWIREMGLNAQLPVQRDFRKPGSSENNIRTRAQTPGS